MKKSILRAIAFALMMTISVQGMAQQKPVVYVGGLPKQLPTDTTITVNPSTSAKASLNIPQGVAPTSPQNGDVWTTAEGIFTRVNDKTIALSNVDLTQPVSGALPILNGGTGGTSDTTYVFGCEAHGFQIQTETVMTSGSAMKWQHIVAGSVITDVSPDKRSYRQPLDFGYRLWDGISFFNTNVTDYTDFLVGYIQGEGVRIYGVDGADSASDIYLDKGAMVGCAKAGLHLGGGFGGLQVGEILMFGNYINCRITNELALRHNREIFFRSDSVFDGAYVYALEINDPRSSGSSITISSFMGSSGLEPSTSVPRPDPTHIGDNIIIKNWNGVVTVKSDKVFNAKRHGIHVQDPDTIVMISDNVFIQTCGLGPDGGYGIFYQNPSNLNQVAQTIYSNAKFGTGFLHNVSGNHNDLTGIGSWSGYRSIGIGSSEGSLGAGWSAQYRFKTIDQTSEMFSVTINIPNNGDGSGYLILYLPKEAAFASPIYGFDELSSVGLSGGTLNNAGYPGLVKIVTSAGAYPAVNNSRLLVSGVLVHT